LFHLESEGKAFKRGKPDADAAGAGAKLIFKRVAGKSHSEFSPFSPPVAAHL